MLFHTNFACRGVHVWPIITISFPLFQMMTIATRQIPYEMVKLFVLRYQGHTKVSLKWHVKVAFSNYKIHYKLQLWTYPLKYKVIPRHSLQLSKETTPNISSLWHCYVTSLYTCSIFYQREEYIQLNETILYISRKWHNRSITRRPCMTFDS